MMKAVMGETLKIDKGWECRKHVYSECIRPVASPKQAVCSHKAKWIVDEQSFGSTRIVRLPL